MKISLVLSTYNRPDALSFALAALLNQSDKDFELVIADDGSGPETQQVVQDFQNKFLYPIIHAWQPDEGFRLSASRNNAIRQSSGDYLVFLDGDCLARPNFIQNHKSLAEKNYFVTGNRVLLSETFTKDLLASKVEAFNPSLAELFALKKQREINRIFSLLDFTSISAFRKNQSNNWKKLRGCNFAAWRKDIYEVNGFDENFKGWGFEDSDFAVRMLNKGFKRKAGSFSTTVFHLYHTETKKAQKGPSWDILMSRLKDGSSYCPDGLKKTASKYK